MAHATVNFLTEALKRPVTINVVFPNDKMVLPNKKIPEKKPFKTLYLLEGVTGNYTGAVHYTKIQPLAEDYNLCVVMIGGDNKWYCDSTITGDLYGKLVCEDIVQYTRDTFRLSEKREDTFIGGFSMGGFGAMVNGLRRPDIFSHIVMFDAALQKGVFLSSVNEPGHDMMIRKNYEALLGVENIEDYIGSEQDYEAQAERVAKSGQALPKIFMTCGEKDGLMPVNVALRDRLKGLGFEVAWDTVPGGHSWQSYDDGLRKAMEWLPLDGFEGNIPEASEDANFGWEEYLNWRLYYKEVNRG